MDTVGRRRRLPPKRLADEVEEEEVAFLPPARASARSTRATRSAAPIDVEPPLDESPPGGGKRKRGEDEAPTPVQVATEGSKPTSVIIKLGKERESSFPSRMEPSSEKDRKALLDAKGKEKDVALLPPKGKSVEEEEEEFVDVDDDEEEDEEDEDAESSESEQEEGSYGEEEGDDVEDEDEASSQDGLSLPEEQSGSDAAKLTVRQLARKGGAAVKLLSLPMAPKKKEHSEELKQKKLDELLRRRRANEKQREETKQMVVEKLISRTVRKKEQPVDPEENAHDKNLPPTDRIRYVSNPQGEFLSFPLELGLPLLLQGGGAGGTTTTTGGGVAQGPKPTSGARTCSAPGCRNPKLYSTKSGQYICSLECYRKVDARGR